MYTNIRNRRTDRYVYLDACACIHWARSAHRHSAWRKHRLSHRALQTQVYLDPSICPSVCLSFCFSICLSIYIFFYEYVCVYIYTYIYTHIYIYIQIDTYIFSRLPCEYVYLDMHVCIYWARPAHRPCG